MFAFIIFILVFSVFWLIVPIDYLIKFTSDDSYFYLKTALNFSLGNGSSFDGINLTNGYHPLWFLIISLFYKILFIFNINSEISLFKVVFVVTSLISAFSLILLYKIFNFNDNQQSFKLKFYACAITLIPLNFFYLIGMEVQVFTLIFLSVIYFFLRLIKNSFNNRKDKFILGLSLSMLFLSRVDLYWYVVTAIVIYTFYSYRHKLKEVLNILIPSLLVFLAYVFFNKFTFGTFYPISSKYKLSFNILDNLKFFPLPDNNIIDFNQLMIIIFFSFVSFIALIKSKMVYAYKFKILFYMNFAFLLFLVVNIFFNSNGIREWYYSYVILSSALLFYHSISKEFFIRLIIVIVIIFNFFYFTIFRMNYYNHESAIKFATALRELVSDEAKIYQIDYSGLTSYFSGKKIINGDGLINSYEYYQYIRDGKLSDYLNKVKPQYLIFYSFSNPIRNDSLHYIFKLFKEYEVVFHKSKIIYEHSFLYGGIFRRKIGNFYLVKFDEYRIKTY